MGSTARPRYIGLREISERDILELYCSTILETKYMYFRCLQQTYIYLRSHLADFNFLKLTDPTAIIPLFVENVIVFMK